MNKETEAFLNATKTKVSFELVRIGKHFVDDNHIRPIYKFTIASRGREYTGEFGDSVDALNKLKRIFNHTTGNPKNLAMSDDLIALGKIGEVAFFDKSKRFISKTKREQFINQKPTAYDLLAGMSGEVFETFQDFCDCFGYDTDSIKATKIHEAVNLEGLALRGLYNNAELELLNEIN